MGMLGLVLSRHAVAARALLTLQEKVLLELGWVEGLG